MQEQVKLVRKITEHNIISIGFVWVIVGGVFWFANTSGIFEIKVEQDVYTTTVKPIDKKLFSDKLFEPRTIYLDNGSNANVYLHTMRVG